MLEVEQKFPVQDLDDLLQRLTSFGSSLGPAELQVDRYFAHPARDFARTDEALRIRSVGPRNWITYKGPKLDATTKTRREIELPLADGPQGAQSFGELLVALGFKPVVDVRKLRRKWAINSQGSSVEVVVDDVEGLGTFVELEVMARPEDVAAAQAAVASLAQQLALSASERRSYLELLLERKG